MKRMLSALAFLTFQAAVALAAWRLAGWNTLQQAGLAMFSASLAAFLIGGGAALAWLQRASLAPPEEGAPEEGEALGLRGLARALAAGLGWSLALALAGVVGLVIGSIAWMAG